MVKRKVSGMPVDLARAKSRFVAWRRVREPGTRIPERLWSAAVELARVHGLARVASFLGLDYYALKKRVGLTERHSVEKRPFVELPAALAAPSEYIIECDDGMGSTMRIHVKGQDRPDVISLARNFWSAN